MLRASGVLVGSTSTAGVHEIILRLLTSALFSLAPLRPGSGLPQPFMRRRLRTCILLCVRLKAAWFSLIHAPVTAAHVPCIDQGRIAPGRVTNRATCIPAPCILSERLQPTGVPPKLDGQGGGSNTRAETAEGSAGHSATPHNVHRVGSQVRKSQSTGAPQKSSPASNLNAQHFGAPIGLSHGRDKTASGRLPRPGR
jgi:hypothetical protein